jgi:rhodanese-related sulfurtransferase
MVPCGERAFNWRGLSGDGGSVTIGSKETSMVQTITTGYKALCEAAAREVETLPVEQAIARAGRDDTVLVDIRDIRELEREGRVPGAFHCPRGMLEFWIDPQSPYHKPVFAQDKTFVFFCAGGLRSALAAQTAQRMGLKPVAHVEGGFGAWKASGGPVEAPRAPAKKQA